MPECDTGPLSFTCFDEAFFECSKEWLKDPELTQLIDAPSVSDIERHNWFTGLKNRTDYRIWGVWLGPQRIGACGLKSFAGDRAEYWGYIGDKSLWGRGLGSSMVHHCIEEARRRRLAAVYLKVLKSNERAVRLYRRLGFVVVSEGDQLVMELSISCSASAHEVQPES
jgi:RimJ/RimL family protein N-acetyltransferase